MTSTRETLEQAAARFIVDFGPRDIDQDSTVILKKLIKDQFAIQVGASQLPWSKQIRKFRTTRPGKSTVVGETGKASAIEAAFINASYGHGFEYDDFIGYGHPGCCVVPAAFALGEEVGASLEQVLVALVAGYEAYARIGFCSRKLAEAGWQAHSLLANFGAAAVAAKLYDFSEAETFNALAIALSHAGGPLEYTSTGGSIKRAHAGMSLRNGLEAALMARAGVTGPTGFLTGNNGFYKMFAGLTVGHDRAALFAPGAAMQLPTLSFKAYCCCALIAPYIEALAQVKHRVDDIERIDAGVKHSTDIVVGNKNTNSYNPRSIEELQYSLPVEMALTAYGYGNGFKAHLDYLEGRIDLGADTKLIAFARKIKMVFDPRLDTGYEHHVGEIIVHYKDGASETIFRERSQGSPAAAWTRDEHHVKLNELVAGKMRPEASEELFSLVDGLDPATPVEKITSLLQCA